MDYSAVETNKEFAAENDFLVHPSSYSSFTALTPQKLWLRDLNISAANALSPAEF
jgi:hypothetical protein